jgi:hypothetical protein
MPGLTGSWIVDVTNENSFPTAKAVEVWACCAGGTLVVNGQYSPRVDIGSWRMLDDHNFEYVLAVVLFRAQQRVADDPADQPMFTYAGSVIDSGSGTLNADFSEHVTRHTFTVFDKCNVFVTEGRATGVATRIPTHVTDTHTLPWSPTIHPGADCS